VLWLGCTANNVTYGLLGDALGFWQFFPAPLGWARIPAWGVAEVVATRTNAVSEGERFFGFCPMAAEMLLTPRATPAPCCFPVRRARRRPRSRSCSRRAAVP
jgi:uncharacterized protein DUF2855